MSSTNGSIWELENGTANVPSLCFTGSKSLGIYQKSANVMAFVVQGQEVATVSSSGLTGAIAEKFANGTAAAPSLSFSSDATTGLYYAATGHLRVAGSGHDVVDFNYNSGPNIVGKAGAAGTTYFYQDNDTGVLICSGGSGSTSGANINLYGGAHATKAGVLELKNNTTIALSIDAAGASTFSGNVASSSLSTNSFRAGGIFTQISAQLGQTVTSDSTAACIEAATLHDGNTARTFAGSHPSCGIQSRFWRRITLDTTDTSSLGYAGLVVDTRFDVSTGKAFTYADGDGVCGIRVLPSILSGGGTLALLKYAGINIDANSVNTGTTKYGIYIGDQTASSTNYQLYSSGLAASKFEGLVGVQQAIGNVTDALPTQAEMVTNLGAANVGTGMIGVIKDANTDTNFFICISNGTSWYALKMTKGA